MRWGDSVQATLRFLLCCTLDNPFRLICVLIAFCLLALLVPINAEGTPASTLISNQASVSFNLDDVMLETKSNIVTTEVIGVCSVSILPDGSVSAPAYNLAMRAGETLYLAYQLTNTGNKENTLLLSYITDAISTLSLRADIIWDQDGNAAVDDGEPVITELTLGADETVDLLLAVSVDASEEAGNAYLGPVASCLDDAATTDDNNLAHIRVVGEGVRAFEKRAEPVDGTVLAAGNSVTYTVHFIVDDLELNDILLTDELSEYLEAPTLELLLNGTPVAGASYDEASHTVSALVDELVYGDVVELTVNSTLKANVPGGSDLINQASLTFDEEEILSNETRHPISAVCAPSITPDGSLSEPAYTVTGFAGETHGFPYDLRNTGNLRSTYSLTTEILVESSFSPAITIIHDLNANGLAEADEPSITSIELNPEETASLVLVVAVNESGQGDAFVNLQAVCDTGEADSNNISQLSILLGAFETVVKGADPEPGTALFPSAKLDYFISFSTQARALTNVVIEDALDEHLAAPREFTTGLVVDAETGLSATVSASYDEASHTLSWRFEALPAGMSVNLSVTTQVREDLVDLPEASVITNTAYLRSDETSQLPTNQVVHDLRPMLITLEKTASPQLVRVGEDIEYTLLISNPIQSVVFERLELKDTLPPELRYLPSARAQYPDGSEETLEPTQIDGSLTWSLRGLAPGESLSLTFSTKVLAEALFLDEITNTAAVIAFNAEDRQLASADASARTLFDAGVFAVKPVLLGTAFLDVNDTGTLEQGVDKPVEGLRLYLSDGRSTVTDEFGRYTFQDLSATVMTLRVDATTAPARFYHETLNEVKEGFWRLRLEPGVVIRQDIPFVAADITLSLDQTLTVYKGPVQLSKRLELTADGVRVKIELSVNEAVKALRLTEVLPAGATLERRDDTLTSLLTANGFVLELGNLEAGDKASYSFDVALDDAPETLLLAPELWWDTR